LPPFLAESGQEVGPIWRALRPHRESVPIPVHDSHAVAPLREEHEQVSVQRIVSEHVAHDHHQAVRSLAPVNRLGGYE
jgi:hypothetical protein